MKICKGKPLAAHDEVAIEENQVCPACDAMAELAEVRKNLIDARDEIATIQREREEFARSIERLVTPQSDTQGSET